MFRFMSRAVRWTCALMLPALAACANEPRPTTARPSQRTAVPAGYDTITVTNTSGGTGAGSLRWALRLATGGETIRFHPALAGATIMLDTTLQVPFYVTIEGPRTGGITISGDGNVRVLQVYRGASLRNVMIAGGGDQVVAGEIYGPRELEPQIDTVNNDQAPSVRATYARSAISATARSRVAPRARSRSRATSRAVRRTLVTPESGSFDNGSAAATARTNDIPTWITPTTTSSTVKLARSRK